ncbi:MAG TPA: exosortase A [Steroidobacteraceae bacterium]|nr:exosortase A [Steroidobacteraceae bacterium]
MASQPSSAAEEPTTVLAEPFLSVFPLTRYRRWVTIVGLGLLVMVVYAQTFASTFELYLHGDFHHHFFVYPAVAYVLYRQERSLIRAPVAPSVLGLVALAALVLVWSVSRTASVQLGEQVAAILMIPTFVFALMGGRVLQAAAFPMLLFLAAIPLGDGIIPALMEVTADIATFLLNLFGIPAYREGMLISLPNGEFQVAAACAGFNFLSAGVTCSLICSYFLWNRWKPRLIFVGIAAVAFVLANGVRAFIVMAVASATHMKYLAGHDHVTFGMILFAVLLFGLLWFANKYADAPGSAPKQQAAPEPSVMSLTDPAVRGRNTALALVALLLLVAGPAAQAYRQGAAHSYPETLQLPELPGCTRGDAADAKWQPTMKAADREARALYLCDDVVIEAYVAAYINQQQGRELVSVGNVLVPARWIDSGARRDAEVAGLPVNVVETEEGADTVYAMYGYDVNGQPARSVYAEKILEMRAALSLRPVVARAYLVNARAPRESTAAMRQRVSELTRALLADSK